MAKKWEERKEVAKKAIDKVVEIAEKVEQALDGIRPTKRIGGNEDVPRLKF